MNGSNSRRILILVLVFVIVCVGFITLDQGDTLDPLKSGLRNLFAPVLETVGHIGDDPADDSELARQVEQLTTERDKLLAENAALKTQLAETDQLRDILNVQQANPTLSFVTANVVGTDPSGLQKFVTIDKGSRDGLRVGMAVVDPFYYVGLVTRVEEDSAQITLAIDATASVAAQLLDSRAVGIVYGRWQTGGRLELTHVERSVTPAEGELVVTSSDASAQTANVPPGLVIGKVSGEPRIDNQADSQVIEVLPACDFENLTVVAVIISSDGGDGE